MPWWAGVPLAIVTYLVFDFLAHLFGLAHGGIDGIICGYAPLIARYAPPVILFVWVVAVIQQTYRVHLLRSRPGIEPIRALSWREFEILVREAIRSQGYTFEERSGAQPDGRMEFVARRAGESILIQCKQWKDWRVGVRAVRELYLRLHFDGTSSAVIITTGEFTRAAQDYAEGEPIRLMDGAALVEFINPCAGRRETG
jgi:restriction system protein